MTTYYLDAAGYPWYVSTNAPEGSIPCAVPDDVARAITEWKTQTDRRPHAAARLLRLLNKYPGRDRLKRYIGNHLGWYYRQVYATSESA